MGRILLLSDLVEKEACSTQVRLFKKHFGDSVEVTPELAVSVALVFDWEWAAWHLLSASALKVYNESVAPAWKVYDESSASAFAKAYIGDE